MACKDSILTKVSNVIRFVKGKWVIQTTDPTADTVTAKVLAQADLTDTDATVYSAPILTKTLVTAIYVTNTSASARTVTIYVNDQGSTYTDSNALIYNETVQPNSRITILGENIVSIDSGSIGAVSDGTGLVLNIFGIEATDSSLAVPTQIVTSFNSRSGVVVPESGDYSHSQITLDDGTNPHNTTKADVGLGNVDNTSDANKPVSTATQTALNLKYDASNPNNYIDSAGAPVQPSDIADFETSTELDARDTANRNRANHTGTQTASTISDFDTEVSNNSSVVANTAKISADGSIGTHSDIDLTGLANNDLLKYNSVSGNFEVVPQSSVGVTDHSDLNLDDGTNPHGTTKSDVGLANVDNTSDLNKPVSTATQNALNLKYDASNPNNYIDASGAPVQLTDIADFETTTELNTRDTNNRNRANHTGTQLASTISDFDTEVSNNTDVAANTAKVSADGSIATHSDVDLTALANNDLLKYNSVSGNFEPVAQADVGVTDHSALNLDDGTNPHGTTKADVGLGNVDNTSDANKPISSATQTALNDKLDSVVAGSNVTVDNTDPNNPVINSTSKWIDGNNPNDAVYLDGDVGIGKSSPLEKLDVEGNLAVRNKIQINSDNTATGGPSQNTGFNIYCSAETSAPFGNSAKNGLYIAPATNTNSRFYLGDPNNNIYSLNLSFVTTVENMPSFRAKDGLIVGGQGSHCITRTTPNKTIIRASGNNSSIQFDTGPSFNDRIQRMLLDVEGNLKIGLDTPDTRLHVDGAITQNPLSTDPPDPSNGNSVQWVSDGTGSGDAGDVMMKINVGGTVKTITLVDFSAV